MPPVRNDKRDKRRSKGISVEVASVMGAGTSKINKKIRDIERLLAKRRDKLPANIIVENERALAALKVEKENAQYVAKVKKFSEKYRMVRFFEKKKALRRYKQVKSEYDALVNEGTAEKKELKKLRKKLQHCEIDLAYVVNFPRDQKYIALYPNEKSNNEAGEEAEANEESKKAAALTEEQRNTFKKEIEKMIKENTLPVSIADILAGKTVGKVSQKLESAAPDAPQQSTKEQQQEEDEDDFFE